MTELSLRQKKFADEYIISGNATKSAIEAGYSKKTAESIGSRLLRNVKVSEYISKRTQEVFEERAMSVAEALAISASIARGEIQQGQTKKSVKVYVGDQVEEETVTETEYQFTPTIEERQRSLDHILKVNGAYLDRKEIDVTGMVQFIDDIGIGDDDGE
ncbi:terminase small subunit [Abiotrophia defectiva]|uniref:terminase small subunit n=1 Tax=Abiotrophia defectiva TaxID=46125 RepID=UPI0028D7C6CF|nr:terminase small subunit [Abiotrophia defectiva]